MKMVKKIICLLLTLAVLTCAMTTTLSAISTIAAPAPGIGVQWVSTDTASATLTVVDGLATITTVINGKLNVATRIEVEIRLYLLQNGEWRDTGIYITDYVSGSHFGNSWQRGVILKGTYQAEVIARVYSPNGMDTIYMYPTYEHK